ncbi:hypothetical protein PKF05_00960 [Fusobacterium simiae]|uniref:hypothetical protein n=1 Tax=Fusobacterium TaxID=848 RepID=UPI0004198F40|nr:MULTISPECIES: hypothetical protein [Fusobacterium]MDC7954403.1 hypothetical protein [Fusobacterium simiae]
MKKSLIYLLGIFSIFFIVSCSNGVDESRIYHNEVPLYSADEKSSTPIIKEVYIVRPDGKDYPNGLMSFIKDQVKNCKEPEVRTMYFQEDIIYLVPLSVLSKDVDVNEKIEKYLKDNGYTLDTSLGIDRLDMTKFSPSKEKDRELYEQVLALGRENNYFQERYYWISYNKNKK